MNKWKWFWVSLAWPLLTTVISCKDAKQAEEKKKYISIPSLIREQIIQVDTSVFLIRKTVTRDSLPADTSYIRREDFGAEAKDFLAIPDLSDPKIARRYQQSAPLLDELLNRVIITFTPLDDTKEEFKKLEILVTPDPLTGDRVSSVIITSVLNNRDRYLKKEMLWQMDKSFQVVTSSQLPGEPEKTTITRVTWNEEPDQ